MARESKAVRKRHYSSVYLDLDSRDKLDSLVAGTKQSKSQVMCGLIQQADATAQARIMELVAELADLLRLR